MAKKINSILLIILDTPPKLVLDTCGDFTNLFTQPAQNSNFEIINLKNLANFSQDQLENISRVVISGAAAMIGDNPPWLKKLTQACEIIINLEIPILGVCFGHQLIAQIFGAEVGPNPKGSTNGVIHVTLERQHDKLFQTFPREFPVFVSHRDSIIKPAKCLEILGTAWHDSYHVYRIKNTIWGVQFHPEFTQEVSRNYILARHEKLVQEFGAQKVNNFIESIRPCPAGHQLLQNFYNLVGGSTHI